ncbi:hypothetical protein EVAR_56267_1 [Eumeta japonica]|uniref:Uncharacterized protein n=1 Tax=Eumeta variegata TaxID=151549 RepID=A0A4C1YFP9_EUMVA|nr:hypothetical protein EVAR_56267_1 [Eumeta japonica]
MHEKVDVIVPLRSMSRSASEARVVGSVRFVLHLSPLYSISLAQKLLSRALSAATESRNSVTKIKPNTPLRLPCSSAERSLNVNVYGTTVRSSHGSRRAAPKLDEYVSSCLLKYRQPGMGLGQPYGKNGTTLLRVPQLHMGTSTRRLRARQSRVVLTFSRSIRRANTEN